MVSAGVVQNDLSSLKSYLSTYNSEIGNLNSNWKGPSYDNLVSKAEEFLSEYSSTIEGEMSAFATACDLYEQYKTVKSSLEAAQRNYNAAVNNKDSSAASSYSSQVSRYSSQLASLKSQIQSSLESASASTLTASSISSGVSPLTLSSSVGAKKMVDLAMAELGNCESDGTHHKYEAYNGLSDDQPWCAAFVSWVAGQAGYLDNGSFPQFVGCSTGFRKFQEMGAEVHYGSSDYTPQAGDIVFFSWSGTDDLDHVGIVTGADADYTYTIEGNTSDGVYEKSRPRDSTIYAYVTPQYV